MNSWEPPAQIITTYIDIHRHIRRVPDASGPTITCISSTRTTPLAHPLSSQQLNRAKQRHGACGARRERIWSRLEHWQSPKQRRMRAVSRRVWHVDLQAFGETASSDAELEQGLRAGGLSGRGGAHLLPSDTITTSSRPLLLDEADADGALRASG
jgi:hypothetical protein